MGKLIDITNQKFGRWTVLKRVPGVGRALWLCQCECGTQKIIRGDCLRNGSSKSCGCLNKEIAKQTLENNRLPMKDLTGQSFGKLTVLEKILDSETNHYLWKCQCECGNITFANSYSLTSGSKKSCGCLARTHWEGKNVGFLTVIKDSGQRTNKNREILWECKCKCGNIIYVSTSNLRTMHTTSCGCQNFSIGELKIKTLLNSHNIPFESQKIFETCKFQDSGYYAKFDFYVNNQYLIEYDGEQHFQYKTKSPGWNTEDNFRNLIKRDQFKNEWCKENNIPLIRIPYTHLNDLCIEDLQLETTSYLYQGESNVISNV